MISFRGWERVAVAILLAAGVTGGSAFAQTETDSVPVVYGLAPDLNEFYLYADGGWDGNWYVGYSNCWLIKLPSIAKKGYKKAYIGARLGRAKGFPVPNRPWEKQPVDGKIYMGLSKDGGFNSRQSYFLVDNNDIPLEAQPKETIKGVGGAQWFWTEVPLDAVSSVKPNYLALWAESDFFTDAAKSPIIAGASRKNSGEDAVWLNSSQKGTPPRDAKTAFELPIKNLIPAMAVKLIPENELSVVARAFKAVADDTSLVLSFSVIGQDVSRAWIEISYDRFNWLRFSKFMFEPPYSFTVLNKNLPKGKYYFRAVATDALENVGYSEVLAMNGADVQ
ncbi:MAG: hypothetical protein PHW69_03490 [Elusimicrobiaceae bacterium]|nr:hypothetical protein [Elusimicrobiaceae bacterium]